MILSTQHNQQAAVKKQAYPLKKMYIHKSEIPEKIAAERKLFQVNNNNNSVAPNMLAC